MSQALADDRLDGLRLRMTYRTARVLAAIGDHPGASNVQIAARVEILDQGQISKLLARLARLGLIENVGPHSVSSANAWLLTPRGSEVDSALRRGLGSGERGACRQGDD